MIGVNMALPNNDNINLKNLINLSTQTEIDIFTKNKKIKDKDKILKECDKIKKQELKKTSSMLSNLAKLNQDNDIKEVQLICQNLENKITNVEKMIDCVKMLETKEKKEKKSNYIECYSNC
jgi:hypothetical protein